MTVLQRLPVWLGDALPHEDKDGMTMNEEHSQAKNRAALVSLLAACLLTAIKLVVGIYTNSLGILSEALHSGLDLLAAAMTLYAVRLSSRPADARHPYGHGKVENLSALGETVLLFVICVWVVYEGAGRLLSGDTPVAPSIWGIIVMGISIVIDVNRVRVLKKGGVFALNDDMKPKLYGDMDAFAQKLREMGYQDVRLIDTAEEAFGSRRRAAMMMLGSSRLLVGRK